MLGRIKRVERQLQEKRSLYPEWQAQIQSGREREERARAALVLLVRLPVEVLFIASLGGGAFRERHAGEEEEEKCDEEGADDGRVEGCSRGGG